VKTIKTASISCLLLAFLTMSLAAATHSDENGLTGSWSFEVPGAPWEYNNGKMMFTKADEELNGKITFHTGRELTIPSVTVGENRLTFVVYVEGYRVKTHLTMDGDTLSGYAETPEGNLDIRAVREATEG
jgi:hypothetical protein